MKKLFVTFCLVMVALALKAVPALPQWQTVAQNDGTTIEVMLVGDEHFHFFVTRDGIALLRSEGNMYYAKAENNRLVPTNMLAHELSQRTDEELSVAMRAQEASEMRRVAKPRIAKRVAKGVGDIDHPDYIGNKKGLIVLVNFSDTKFENYSTDDDGQAVRSQYDDIANKKGYTNSMGAIGSVSDYFFDQSGGRFELNFDVVGPVNLDKPASYYGKDKSNDEIDWMMPELIRTACEAIDNEVDFTIYDWDGDGEVEEVFFLYAGKGQATGGGDETIWPHMYSLDDWKEELNQGDGAITLDGVRVNTYACSNEIYMKGMLMGIGVFCHEFSHCLGFPDFYDTSYGGSYGMAGYDVLDRGSYNGPSGIGWVPAGYTAYERAYAGWMTLTPLQNDTIVEALKPINEEMQAFVVKNDAYPDEYYILECRNETRWDSYIPSSGLLIVYVDYDLQQWRENSVNTVTDADDHQRMTVFRASDSDIGSDWFTIPDTYPFEDEYGWFGGITNNELTDTSSPSAYLHHANVDGSFLMHKPIYNIARDKTKGTVSFGFKNEVKQETGIQRHENNASELSIQLTDADIYTLDGQFAGRGSSLKHLPHGIYMARNKQGKSVKIVL